MSKYTVLLITPRDLQEDGAGTVYVANVNAMNEDDAVATAREAAAEQFLWTEAHDKLEDFECAGIAPGWAFFDSYDK